MSLKGIFIRNIEADDLLEIFLVSAISSLFSIRFFLFITGYPQLGGRGIHVAHMLWGGLFMTAALILLLTFLNRFAMQLAAVIGGIGFGAFIDELGKFLTSDNNYFFQPAVAIIYVIFILLFLLFRMIPQYRAYSKKEYLINALDMTQEAVINDLDVEEERLAFEYLQKSDLSDPIAQWLYELLSKIEAIQPKKPGYFLIFRRKLRSIYQFMTKSFLLARFVIFFLLLQAALAIGLISYSIAARIYLSFDKWGVLITALVAAVFILEGFFLLRSSRLRAYSQFKIAVMIFIFLTQFFLFYSFQFYALSTLLPNLFILAIIDYAIKREREKTIKEQIMQKTTQRII